MSEPRSTEPSSATVIVMTAGGPNPAIVINALAGHYPNLHVVREQPESKGDHPPPSAAARLDCRARADGHDDRRPAPASAVRAADRRAAPDKRPLGDNPSHIPIHDVSSINDPATLALVAGLKPAAICSSARA